MSKNGWRMIKESAIFGSENMAKDYAILKAVGKGEQPPTLRFYKWKKPTITIGRFQSPSSEVYLDEAKKRDIDVIRRITGGGTVFHDLEITYSFVIPVKHPLMKKTILDTFGQICEPIINALIELGVPAKYQPINDITANGKKISGNAQVRKHGAILQHGTILLGINLNDIKTLLTGKGSNKLHIIDEISGEKIVKEVNHVTRVGSLVNILGEKVFSDKFRSEIEKKIQIQYEKQFSTTFKVEKISKQEIQESVEIEKSHFNNQQWNFKIK